MRTHLSRPPSRLSRVGPVGGSCPSRARTLIRKGCSRRCAALAWPAARCPLPCSAAQSLPAILPLCCVRQLAQLARDRRTRRCLHSTALSPATLVRAMTTCPRCSNPLVSQASMRYAPSHTIHARARAHRLARPLTCPSLPPTRVSHPRVTLNLFLYRCAIVFSAADQEDGTQPDPATESP